MSFYKFKNNDDLNICPSVILSGIIAAIVASLFFFIVGLSSSAISIHKGNIETYDLSELDQIILEEIKLVNDINIVYKQVNDKQFERFEVVREYIKYNPRVSICWKWYTNNSL